MSNKKIKIEPLILTGKRRRENKLDNSTELSNFEIKRNKNGYYCCIHSEKEICEIYFCSGNSIPHFNHNDNTIKLYVN